MDCIKCEYKLSCYRGKGEEGKVGRERRGEGGEDRKVEEGERRRRRGVCKTV